MKVTFENHYNCSVTFCNEEDGMYDAPAPFEDINAALAYCEEEIDVRHQAISAVIWDTLTGEVYATCGFDENDIPEEDYPVWDDDVDESNYDPYAGCDMYEVEPFDFGGDF